MSRLLDCGWTPGVQVTAQPETQQPETPQPETQQPGTQQPVQEQPEPQQASPPTSYEAWVTQTPDQDYAAKFTYYVPEGMYKRYDVTLHVQLTPADASIDGVHFYVQNSAMTLLMENAAEVGGGTIDAWVPPSATACTHRGGGHYTRTVPVTFNTVDDAVVDGGHSWGRFEVLMQTTTYRGQNRRGAGSTVDFIHVEDDRTYPTIGNIAYTSDTAGTFTVVSQRMASGLVSVTVVPSGSARFHQRNGYRIYIPGNSTWGTAITQDFKGAPLNFTCNGAGDGWLTLTRHWLSNHQIEASHSHKVQVCPAPATGKHSDYLTREFDASLNCQEIDRLNRSGAAGIFGWVDKLDGPNEVCNQNLEYLWELLGYQSFQMQCAAMSGEGRPHNGLMAVTVNGNLLLAEDHLLRLYYRRGCYH